MNENLYKGRQINRRGRVFTLTGDYAPMKVGPHFYYVEAIDYRGIPTTLAVEDPDSLNFID